VHNETAIAGIHLDYIVEQVIVRLGKPDRVMTHPSAKPGYESKTYEWERPSARLRIAALGDGRIMRVDVLGRPPDDEIGSTGKGLKLGDTIQEAKRIYLPISKTNSLPEWNWNFSTPDCPIPRSNLELHFDKQGGIDHMNLSNEAVFCW
jgi:hypothetical protein